ncbi:unnamed protein product [Dicrocoelium dendriticum]|nr:unnamed protein product [Dicrocoelium dendriticum]
MNDCTEKYTVPHSCISRQREESSYKDHTVLCNNRMRLPERRGGQPSDCATTDFWSQSVPLRRTLPGAAIYPSMVVDGDTNYDSLHVFIKEHSQEPQSEFERAETQHLPVEPRGHMHSERRTSLHGKTLPARMSRNETRYRKLQAQVYNFLERPKTWTSFVYHGLVFASVFTCLILSVLSTVDEYAHSASRILLYMELAILFWFFAEYCIRLWSAGCRSRYQTWQGRFHFARRPFCIVDFVVIVASVVVLAVDSDRNMFAASALRGLRFFQILRMIRMDRRGGSFKLLASVVWAHRQELFTTMYIGFLGLLFASFLIYLVEKKENEKIRTYADALWWGVVTLCTVGYGDTVPRTWLGKIIAAFCSLAGISFFALPAGILGSGFALKVQQHQRQKHLIRRRVPAATLIQCLWRCYAADSNSSSVATWKIHTRPIRRPTGLTSSYSLMERGGFSRLARFSTLRRRPDKPITTGASNFKSTEWIESVKRGIPHITCDHGQNDEPQSSPLHREMSESATLLPYQPYANKLETLGENLVAQPRLTRHESDKGLSNFELPMVDAPEALDTEVEQFSPRSNSPAPWKWASRRSYTHNTADANEVSEVGYLGERSPSMTPRGLTEQDKTVIRIVRKIRFLVARRKFREALRPYDVKDVIEQYSAGHLDMLSRVKTLQSRVDEILGRQSGKPEDVYSSHQSLASRIVKIERKIDAIEMKIDRLSSMYKSDRMFQQYKQATSTQRRCGPEEHPPSSSHESRGNHTVMYSNVQKTSPVFATLQHEGFGGDTMNAVEQEALVLCFGNKTAYDFVEELMDSEHVNRSSKISQSQFCLSQERLPPVALPLTLSMASEPGVNTQLNTAPFRESVLFERRSDMTSRWSWTEGMLVEIPGNALIKRRQGSVKFSRPNRIKTTQSLDLTNTTSR